MFFTTSGLTGAGIDQDALDRQGSGVSAAAAHVSIHVRRIDVAYSRVNDQPATIVAETKRALRAVGFDGTHTQAVAPDLTRRIRR